MQNSRGLVFLLGMILLWAMVTGWAMVDPALLPSPMAVASAGWHLVNFEGLVWDLLTTAERVAIALVTSAAIGIPLGLFFGCQPKVYAWVEDVLHALRSIPATCLFPLLLIVIGVGEASIIMLAAYPCTLIFIVNSASGAALTDTNRLHLARSLGATSMEIIAELVFFEALPHITAALRTCVSYALVLVVAVEMFIGVGDNGIGRTIFDLQSNFQVPETYAAILLTGLLGIVINFAVTRFERHALRWLPRLDGA